MADSEPVSSDSSTSEATETKELPTAASAEPEAPESAKPNVKDTVSTPAQDKLHKEIAALNAELCALDCRKKLADWSEERKNLKVKLETRLKEKTSELRRKEKEQERQKKHRLDRKRKFEELFDKDPNLRKELKMKSARGRPSLDASQPELLSVIADIATHGCAADERRRT